MENNQDIQDRIQKLKDLIEYFSDREHLAVGSLLGDLKKELKDLILQVKG